MSNISATTGRIVSNPIISDQKTVHKKDIAVLFKEIRSVHNEVKKFKTNSKAKLDDKGSFFTKLGLKRKAPELNLKLNACLGKVEQLKVKMADTSYTHAKSKYEKLDKMSSLIAKDMNKVGINQRNNRQEDKLYNLKMLSENKKNDGIISRPAREKYEYNGGMVK